MQLKRNALANYAAQAFLVLASILTLPFYVRSMGAEAYGLVGFYTMVQAWFQLLDAGFSTALGRDCSRQAAGHLPGETLLQLERVLRNLFLVLATLALAVGWLAADRVAGTWLRVVHLPASVVTTSIGLMGAVVALRWMSCLYRAVVVGFEHQVWLSSFSILVAALRFIGGIPVLLVFGATPVVFFLHQLAVAGLELLVLSRKARASLPARSGPAARTDWKVVTPSLRFAGAAGVTSIIWVMVTQSDRLILSRALPLPDFGRLTVALTLAGGVQLLGAPLGAALLPRLTALVGADDERGARALYAHGTRVVAVVLFPIAFTLAALAGPILQAWTGDALLAAQMAPVLAAYSLGNAVMGVAAFAYYIQYARGNIRLHLFGNALFVVLYLPVLYGATHRFGALGAGLAWLGMNTLYLALWIPLVHRTMLPGLHLRWIRDDVGAVALLAAVPVVISAALPSPDGPRWLQAAAAAGTWAASAGLACLDLPSVRARLRHGLSLTSPAGKA